MSNWADQHGSDITNYDTPDSKADHPLVDATYETPLLGGFIEHGISNGEGIGADHTTPEETIGSAVGLAGAVTDFGFEVKDFYEKFDQDTGNLKLGEGKDLLINLGLDLALQFIPPLEDLLHQASGSPDDMQDQVDEWQKVHVALNALSNEIADSALSSLQNWGGEAANRAADRVEELCQAIMSISNKSNHIRVILMLCQAVCNLLFEVLKEYLAQFINQLIITGIPALAQAIPTKGLSIVKWIAKAAINAAKEMIKSTKKFFSAMKTYDGVAEKIKFIAKEGEFIKGALRQVLVGGLTANAATATSNLASSSWSDSSSGARNALREGISLDLEDFSQANEAMKGHSENASNILSEARAIGAADMTWGVPGIVFSAWYNNVVDIYIDDIQTAVETIDKCGERLQENGENYSASDSDSASEFDGIDIEVNLRIRHAPGSLV